MPFSLAWYLGRLWAGTYGIGGASAGKVYSIIPGVEETWTLDHTTTVSQGYILSMQPYKGSLFAGTIGDAGIDALVLKRTSSGVWSTSETAPTHVGGSSYQSLVVYESELYAVFEDPGAGGSNLIRKFNGSAWSTDADIYADFGASSDKGHSGQGLVWDGSLYLPLIWTSSTLGAIRKVLKNTSGAWSAVDTLTADGFRGPLGVVRVET